MGFKETFKKLKWCKHTEIFYHQLPFVSISITKKVKILWNDESNFKSHDACWRISSYSGGQNLRSVNLHWALFVWSVVLSENWKCSRWVLLKSHFVTLQLMIVFLYHQPGSVVSLLTSDQHLAVVLWCMRHSPIAVLFLDSLKIQDYSFQVM